MLLPRGTEVDLGMLGSARVRRLIGQGGQGYVYGVERRDGRQFALKWYKPGSATVQQRAVLTRLVELGPPHSRFLWPLGVARVSGSPGFGYVMPLRDDRFVEMGHLVSGRHPDGRALDVSYAAVIAMCRLLADSFLRLHTRGLCYRDISFGNVAFDPANGDVRICDNDNVDIDDGSGRVLGTPLFMAPELVRDLTQRTLPNSDTDRHSLAVILFYALCAGHPLEGRRTDQGLRDGEWLRRHFGTDPVFTFDPDDDSNRPVSPLVTAYWRTYPAVLRETFVRAFTDGLVDPAARVTEGEWIKLLGGLRDSMSTCGSCQATNFADESRSSQPCARCGVALARPLVLTLGRRRVVVGSHTRIRATDTPGHEDEGQDVGRVRSHPRDPARWGLQNRTRRTWVATLPDGRSFDVARDDVVDLLPGLRIDLSTSTLVVGY